jgi:putative FmdB family regulatory protein
MFVIKSLAMPIYAYRCASCGHSRDVLQKMSDPVLTTCPACGTDQFQKQVTAAGGPRRCRRRRHARGPGARAGPLVRQRLQRLGVVVRLARRRQLRLPLTASHPMHAITAAFARGGSPS